MTKPIAHLFRLSVAAEDRARFEEIGRHNLLTSQDREAGTLAMYVSPIKGQATFYVCEVYGDEEAYQVHRQSPQFNRFVTEGMPLLTERQVYELEPFFLKERFGRTEWGQADQVFLKFAQVEVKTPHQTDFQDLVLQEMQASLEREPGVLAFYTFRDCQLPRYYFFEVYENEAAYESHRLTPHFQTYIRETADFLVSKELFDLENAIAISKGKLDYIEK